MPGEGLDLSGGFEGEGAVDFEGLAGVGERGGVRCDGGAAQLADFITTVAGFGLVKRGERGAVLVCT